MDDRGPPTDLASMLGRYSFDFDESDEGTFSTIPRKAPSSTSGHLPPPPPLPPPLPLPLTLTMPRSPAAAAAEAATPSRHQRQRQHQQNQPPPPPQRCRRKVSVTYHRLVLTPFSLKFLHRSPPVKSLWVVAFVLCSAVSGFHFWRLLEAFNSGHTVLARGRPRPFVFPDVTVCPPSAFFRRDVGKPDAFPGSNRTFGYDVLINSAPALWRYVLYGNMTHLGLSQAQREYASRLALQSIFRHYINSSAVLSPLDMIAYCSYQGQLCSMEQFSVFFHPAHGSCATFHPPSRIVQPVPLDHETPGLVMQLHTLSPRDWLLTADPQSSMTHRHSYTVTLHPPMTWPTFDRVAHVTSGRVTSLRVAMRQLWRSGLDDDSSFLTASNSSSAAVYCFGGQTRWCRRYASRRDDRLLSIRQSDLLDDCGCLSDALPVTAAQAEADLPPCVGIREPILLLFDPRTVSHLGKYLYVLAPGGEMRWIEDTAGYAAFKRAAGCFLRRPPVRLDARELARAKPDPVTTVYEASVDSGPWLRSTDTLQAGYIARNMRLYRESVANPEAARRNVSLPVQDYLRRMQQVEFSIHAYQVIQRHTGMLEIRPADLLSQQQLEVWLYPLSQFLADAGGALGLLLGASLVTLLESLDALCLFLCSTRGFEAGRQSGSSAASRRRGDGGGDSQATC